VNNARKIACVDQKIVVHYALEVVVKAFFNKYSNAWWCKHMAALYSRWKYPYAVYMDTSKISDWWSLYKEMYIWLVEECSDCWLDFQMETKMVTYATPTGQSTQSVVDVTHLEFRFITEEEATLFRLTWG
jgi:hypothetical protein